MEVGSTMEVKFTKLGMKEGQAMGLFFKNLFLAVPFYFLWNWLAPIYFTGLPPAFQEIPFLHCIGLLVLLAILRSAVLPTQPIINKIKWKGSDRIKDFIDVN